MKVLDKFSALLVALGVMPWEESEASYGELLNVLKIDLTLGETVHLVTVPFDVLPSQATGLPLPYSYLLP